MMVQLFVPYYGVQGRDKHVMTFVGISAGDILYGLALRSVGWMTYLLHEAKNCFILLARPRPTLKLRLFIHHHAFPCCASMVIYAQSRRVNHRHIVVMKHL